MQKIYPFRFLSSYRREDKDFFFGRDKERDALYKMIFQTRILVLYGTSGTGKTSLIQCGLANKFKSYDWLALYIRRGKNLISSLDKALCNKSEGEFTYVDHKELVIKDLTAKIKAVYKASFKPIYLIFDQLEELYVSGTEEEQKNFRKIVKEILAIEQPVKIILSIREEYLAYLNKFEKEVPQLLRKKLRVEPMDPLKVTQVIIGAAEHKDSNIHLKPGESELLAEGIFNKIKGKGNEKSLTIQLPALQVFMDMFYFNITGDETKKTEAEFSLHELNEMGKIDDVLMKFLEEQVKYIIKKFSSDKKIVTPETLWTILTYFCTLDGTKKLISKEDLVSSLKSENINKKLIYDSVDEFKDRRIIKKSESKDLYELTHDSLALKIAEKRSEDDILKLKVINLIQSNVTKELFTEKQIIFIEPYYHLIASKLKDDEKQLYEDSKKAIHRKKVREKMFWVMLFSAIVVCLIIVSYLLAIDSMKNNFRSDVKPIENYIDSVNSKIVLASFNLVNDPTLALQLDQKALLFLDSAKRMDKFRDKKYGIISHSKKVDVFKKLEYSKLDSIYCITDSLIKAQAQSIIGQNNAFYKIVPPIKKDNLKDTLIIIPSVNRIFPDSTVDTSFKVWNAEKHIIDTIKSRGNLSQLVFPTNVNRAMALYKNGRAGYTNSRGRNYPVYLDSLRYFSQVKDTNLITSIAPVYYNVIGYKMLSALNNNTLVEWNLNGSLRRSPNKRGVYKPVIYSMKDIHLKESIVSIAITRDRAKIFTASDKGIGIIWPADTSNVVLDTFNYKVFGLVQDTILCSAFSKNGKMIATGSKDNTVKIWNAENVKLIKELKGHTGPVTSVAFSANDNVVYTGSLDQTFRQWHLPVADSISEMSTMQWNDSLFIKNIIDLELE